MRVAAGHTPMQPSLNTVADRSRPYLDSVGQDLLHDAILHPDLDKRGWDWHNVLTDSRRCTISGFGML